MKQQEQLMEEIEPILDSTTLADMLLALGRVCNEKAEHIRESYQDAGLARMWDNRAKQLDALSAKIVAPHL